ncbi:cag pathogenicity island VirB5 family T4SS-associated adhesin CagL [Helicobacter pylori]|uniref:cag pathogenicity island VirB5 family T4SS-associated adhesin CagL n=1 Tax=Helicobacter pylori TaxID=210 RepID=UPI000D3B510A|nr:cag pathogenicity island VirB5 family T4SS-associated adhesin CagL [Helicobacter pylori]PUD25744.1 sodium:calcium antiporter [Helicobacter pylori]WQX29552.1 cag pathogenicity island VirB5 family T4SS-associated adhesin CagL [Helicobacter pylori]
MKTLVKNTISSFLLLSVLMAEDITSGLKQLDNTYKETNQQVLKNLDEIFSTTSPSANNEMGKEDALNIKKAAIALRGDLALLKANFEANELFFISEDVIFKTYMSSPELLLTYMKINPLDQNIAEQQCGISDKVLVFYCEGKLKIEQEKQNIRERLETSLKAYQSNIGGTASLITASQTLVESLKNKNFIKGIRKLMLAHNKVFLNYLEELDALERSLEQSKRQYLQERQSSKIIIK